MTAETFDGDVLIVGLGPVGAALAALLVRRGVSVIAIDKDVDVYPLPRAAHFDHEIMRLFQQLGLAETVQAHAQPAPAYEFRAADGQLLMRFDLSAPSASGWSQGYMFNQPGVEIALRALLEASPLADVRLGQRFVRMSRDEAGVSAVIAGPNGETVLRARYVVGCDGARSSVRGALGIRLSDYRFDEPWLVVDAIVKDSARTPSVNLQICDPARPTTCVLMGPGRHRWEFMLLPGETAEQVLDDGFIQALIAKWDCGEAIEIDRKAVYRFHGLIAETWREGRVILAGDSVHQMPPFAGQGMCSGLRDAANLAWKLGAILKDGADEGLLDTYQAEREPHVRAYIELAMGMGAVVCTLDPAAAAARDAGMLAQRAAGAAPAPPPSPPAFQAGCILAGSPGAGALFPQPWAKAEGQTLRLDDVLGDGAWLIARGGKPMSRRVAGLTEHSLSDPCLAPFSGVLGDWLDAAGADAVLIRPDRYIFGAGEAEVLTRAYGRSLGAGETDR